MAGNKGPVLTARRLNRALLDRQLLLSRKRFSLPRAVHQMAGLQAQYAPSMYIGLWSRLAGMSRADLDKALIERQVVQGTLLRSTIHLVAAADYWPWAIAVRSARRAGFRGAHKDAPTDAKFTAAAQRLSAQMGNEALRANVLEDLVDPAFRAGIGLWLEMVRVPPSGTWDRRRADLYGLASEWVGAAPAELTEETALPHLIRQYLAGFGPASKAHVAGWLGLPVTPVGRAMAAMELVDYVDEAGKTVSDLPDATIPDEDVEVPVRFLPTWDATLLVHARRAEILPEPYRPRIFNTRHPQSFPTFLVDGAVAGTWRYEHGKVELTEFHPQPASVRHQLRAEADELAEFHQGAAAD